MNEQERKIAEMIWPEKMPDLYADKRARALAYLGDRYLLAKPVNKRAA